MSATQAEIPEELRSAPEGVVYSCSGERYLAEALESARSSLRQNPLPHLMFTSVDAEAVDGLSLVRFEPSANPYVDKITNMRRSPFARTIYLDSDTFVIQPITQVLQLLDRCELAAAHDPSHRGLPDPQVPDAFYELNTGVLAWRASDRMDAFMRAWEQTYVAWLREEPFFHAGMASRRADQPAFRRCVWEHDLRLCVLGPEYNMRLGEPTTIVEPVRVIHGRHGVYRDYEAIAARVNERSGPRSWPRPIPFRAKVVGRTRKTTRAVRRRLRLEST